MEEKESWDWQTPLKEIPIKEWASRFNWVEDPCITPDGESIASIVNLDEMAFGICVNGELWEGAHEKAYSLKALLDNRFAAAVCQDDEWQLMVDGQAWSNTFDFIWNLGQAPDGTGISAAMVLDAEYGMVINDTPWEASYESMTGMVAGPKGATAAVVQVESIPAADVTAFSKGLFSVARNGVCYDQQYLNAWDLCFDPTGDRLTWAVRFDRETYGVSVDGKLWDNKFQAVWKPVFSDQGKAVIAPARARGKWRLFKDSAEFWENGYENIWRLETSPVNSDIAAIVATSFGQWSVALNDRVWNQTWDTMVRDLYFSADGSALAAVFKDKGNWGLAVNDSAWQLSCDKLFIPSMSRTGDVVGVAFETGGRCFAAVNDKVVTGPYEYMADPVVSADGSKVLVKGIENGVYKRKVISL